MLAFWCRMHDHGWLLGFFHQTIVSLSWSVFVTIYINFPLSVQIIPFSCIFPFPKETLFVCGSMLNYCVLLFKVRKQGNKIMFIYIYICYSFYIYICFQPSAEWSVLRNLLLEEIVWNYLNKGSNMWLLCVDTIRCDYFLSILLDVIHCVHVYQCLYCYKICQKLVHSTVQS